MKEALKWPFTWEERRPHLTDRVLFVPDYYSKHEMSFSNWDDPLVFGRKAPVHVEYCSGNGAWIVNKALTFPDCNWVAVERKLDRVNKIWAKMHAHGIRNLFIVCGEALTFTTHYVPVETIHTAYINFPDPWPKLRHAKNRLIQESFMTTLASKMRPFGELTFVTDDIAYRDLVLSVVAQPWTSCFQDPSYRTELEGYGGSYFDTLWRSLGKEIYYLQFRR